MNSKNTLLLLLVFWKETTTIGNQKIPYVFAINVNHNPRNLQPTLGVASSDSALLYAILSPVGDYFKKANGGAVSLLADPRYTR